MSRRLVPALLVTALVLSAGCRTAPIYQVRGIPLPALAGTTAGDVRQAIHLASNRLGWRVEDSGPNQMLGTLRVRQHTAVVEIHYDAERLSILYRDSDNLLYGGDEIHRNYNRWVRKLEQRIVRQVMRTGS